MQEIVITLIVLAAIAAWIWYRRGGYREGMFAAKASGALHDLGLNVRKLPQEAKTKFFTEAHALDTATKGKFPHRQLAMRFFVWYYTEYPGFDPRAVIGEGRLLQSFITMRQWGQQDARLQAAAHKEMTAIFRMMYDHLESAEGERGELISQQLQLMEFARANGLKDFATPATPDDRDSLSRSIDNFKERARKQNAFKSNAQAFTLSWATGILFYAALSMARNLYHDDIHASHWNTLNHRMIIEMIEDHDVDFPERDEVEAYAFKALEKVEALADASDLKALHDHLQKVFGLNTGHSPIFLIGSFRILLDQSRETLLPDFMARLED